MNEIHVELRRCRSCDTEYMFRETDDGAKINAECPKCGSRKAKTLKVYHQ